MAYLVNGVLYVPIPTELTAVTQETKDTDTSDLTKGNNKETQTDGLRKPLNLNDNIFAILGLVRQQYPGLQYRVLQWGQYRQTSLLKYHTSIVMYRQKKEDPCQ